MKKIVLKISDRVFLLRNCISYRIAVYDEQDRYMHDDTNNIRRELDTEEILLFYFNGIPRACIILGKDSTITQIHLSDNRRPRGEKLARFYSSLLEQADAYALRGNNNPDLINLYTLQNIMYIVNTKVNKMLVDASLINNTEMRLI